MSCVGARSDRRPPWGAAAAKALAGLVRGQPLAIRCAVRDNNGGALATARQGRTDTHDWSGRCGVASEFPWWAA